MEGTWSTSNLHLILSVLSSLNDFDVIVIDEAGQAIEALCWIAILKGTDAFFVGVFLLMPL